MASANSFQFRMGNNFPGDVNRSHPASIEPCVADASAPPSYFGDVGVYSTTGTVRALTTSDTAISGITVRPFPFQQSTTSSAYGGTVYGVGSPVANVPMDLLKSGYIMVKVNSNATGIVRGSLVYVWKAASSGVHVTGQFEGTDPSSNGFVVPYAYFTGPADANGYAEILFP